jgi:hypothetical protein
MHVFQMKERVMSDLYERVTSQQDVFKKLVSKVPGFNGYLERENRRSADKLLRESVAAKFQAIWQRISGIERDLVNAGRIGQLDDVEQAEVKIRQFIDRVNTAAYGYAGFFDAIKIKEDTLAQVYQYDLTLVELADQLSSAVDNLEASLDSDGLPAAIRNLVQKAQDCLDAFNKRSDVMKTGQALS